VITYSRTVGLDLSSSTWGDKALSAGDGPDKPYSTSRLYLKVFLVMHMCFPAFPRWKRCRKQLLAKSLIRQLPLLKLTVCLYYLVLYSDLRTFQQQCEAAGCSLL